jgi:hypothetical protein
MEVFTTVDPAKWRTGIERALDASLSPTQGYCRRIAAGRLFGPSLRAALMLLPRRYLMSLHPSPIGQIPAETMCGAHAAFPHGTVVTRLRDGFANLYRDEDFAALYPRRGQPGLAP